jgi:hypothetical protein
MRRHGADQRLINEQSVPKNEIVASRKNLHNNIHSSAPTRHKFLSSLRQTLSQRGTSTQKRHLAKSVVYSFSSVLLSLSLSFTLSLTLAAADDDERKKECEKLRKSTWRKANDSHDVTAVKLRTCENDFAVDWRSMNRVSKKFNNLSVCVSARECELNDQSIL